MKYSYWIIVLLLVVSSYFFPLYVLPLFIILTAVFLRWLNTLIVKAAKYAKDDTDKCIVAINGCIKMVNDHSALMKRVRLMENDIDDLERESTKIRRDINKTK